MSEMGDGDSDGEYFSAAPLPPLEKQNKVENYKPEKVQYDYQFNLSSDEEEVDEAKYPKRKSESDNVAEGSNTDVNDKATIPTFLKNLIISNEENANQNVVDPNTVMGGYPMGMPMAMSGMPMGMMPAMSNMYNPMGNNMYMSNQMMMNPNMPMGPGMPNPNMPMGTGMPNPNMHMGSGMPNPNMHMGPGRPIPNMPMGSGMANPNIPIGMQNPNMPVGPGLPNPNMPMGTGMQNPYIPNMMNRGMPMMNQGMNPNMMNQGVPRQMHQAIPSLMSQNIPDQMNRGMMNPVGRDGIPPLMNPSRAGHMNSGMPSRSDTTGYNAQNFNRGKKSSRWDKGSDDSAFISKPPMLKSVGRKKKRSESGSGSESSTDASAVFRNDGSFLEVFKKLKESDELKNERTSVEEKETAVKKAQPKLLPSMIGKRRGGRVLKTGVVQKLKKTETPDDNAPKDAWSLYMAEVKKYRDINCEEEGKTRALVK